MSAPRVLGPCAGPGCTYVLVPSRDTPGEGQRRQHGRGLCSTCACRARRNGTLIDYPRSRWRGADVVEDVAVLRSRGVRRLDDLAAALGLTVRSVQRHLARARAGAA